jgi:hypothetical protein
MSTSSSKEFDLNCNQQQVDELKEEQVLVSAKEEEQ